ncbi:MAG: TIGR00725 family protein [Candidatus Omnitrophota bacterium]
MRTQKITISVIGGHDCTEKVAKLAHKAGKFIAEMDCVLVCGGLFGVMMEACRGCKEAGGTSIGILPGKDKADANPFVDIALPSSIGFARNAMIACSADLVVALPGSYGTESEICYALVYKRPVIDLGGWKIQGMIKTKGFEDAKAKMKAIIGQLRNQSLVKE